MATQYKTLWLSKNKKWEVVEVSYHLYDLPKTFIIVQDNDTSWNDNPLRYSDGSVAYDFPYRIPEYVKIHVKRILDNRVLSEVK